MKIKKITILGKNGQLGQEFVKILSTKKTQFDAYSHEELDVSDYEKLEKVLYKSKPDVIVNTTAYHVTSLCETFPLNAFNINCIAVRNLAKISKEIGAKFFTYSTNYVFDGNKNEPYSENDQPNPLQIYGLSKLAGEISALNEYPKGVYVIRTCGVYAGKNGSREKNGNYVLKILKEAKKNGEVFASKKQIVNPTYAPHLAVATLDLINLKADPGIFHLTNKGETSWFEFAKKIVEFSNYKNVKVKEYINDEENKDFKSPVFSALSNIKGKELGIVLPTIEEGLKEYLSDLN